MTSFYNVPSLAEFLKALRAFDLLSPVHSNIKKNSNIYLINAYVLIIILVSVFFAIITNQSITGQSNWKICFNMRMPQRNSKVEILMI